MEEATSMDPCELTALRDRNTAEEAALDDPAEASAEEAALDDPAEVSAEGAALDDPAEVSAEEAALDDPVEVGAEEAALDDPVEASAEETAVDDPAEVSVSAEEVADVESGEQQPGDMWSAEDVGAEYGEDATPVPDSGTDLFESEQATATKPATKLPISKIKKIMKFDPDVAMANQDAVFLVAKATEMFIDGLVKHAGTCVTRGKRKTVQKRDIEFAADSVNNFAFLEGILETM